MKTMILLMVCTVVSIVLFGTNAMSHSGGTDDYGCHHDHKRGGYHCH